MQAPLDKSTIKVANIILVFVNFSLQVDNCVRRLSLYVPESADSVEENAWVKRLSGSGLRATRVEWHAEWHAERQTEGQAERQSGFITAISAAPELYAFWESVEILKVIGVKANAALIRVSQASPTCFFHAEITHGDCIQTVSLPYRPVCCLCTPDTSMTVVVGMILRAIERLVWHSSHRPTAGHCTSPAKPAGG
jgi:hypothetical protein